MWSNNDVTVISTDISKAYNNRHASVLTVGGHARQLQLLLPVTVILGLRLKEGPDVGQCRSMEERNKRSARKLLAKKKKTRIYVLVKYSSSWDGRQL